MSNFTWPADLPDWQDAEQKLWRGIQPNGLAFYSDLRPEMFFNNAGNPTAWTSFSLWYVGETKDQQAIDNWQYSLERRNQVYWKITSEYQVIQHDASVERSIDIDLYDSEYTAYLKLSEMADDIFLSALSEMDIAAKIRARFFEYIKSKNQNNEQI
jgi:hypothetical protein